MSSTSSLIPVVKGLHGKREDVWGGGGGGLGFVGGCWGGGGGGWGGGGGGVGGGGVGGGGLVGGGGGGGGGVLGGVCGKGGFVVGQVGGGGGGGWCYCGGWGNLMYFQKVLGSGNLEVEKYLWDSYRWSRPSLGGTHSNFPSPQIARNGGLSRSKEQGANSWGREE